MLFENVFNNDVWLDLRYTGVDYQGTIGISVLSLVDGIVVPTLYEDAIDFVALTRHTSHFKLPEGPIISIALGTITGEATNGQIHCRTNASFQDKVGGLPAITLGSGYITTLKPLVVNGSISNFPYKINRYKQVIEKTIAVGDNLFHQFTGQNDNKITSVHFDFVTDAGGIGRVPFFQFRDLSDNEIYTRISGFSVAASQTVEVNGVCNVADAEIVNTSISFQLPDIDLPQAADFTFGFQNIAAGDQISNAFLLVEVDGGTN